MVSGSSGSLTTNLFLTFSKTSLSTSDVTKEMARPLVPKRPALRILRSFSQEKALPSNSVQIGIFALRHVVVDNDVNSFKVNTTTENVGSNHDGLLVRLESFVQFHSVDVSQQERLSSPLFRIHGAKESNGWETLRNKELVQGGSSLNRAYEDNKLVEL